MEKTLSFMVKVIISLLAALFVNLLVLFIVPPTTTFGIIIKDALSLLVGCVIFFILLRKMKK